jgi:hypothetical protein
LRRKKRSLQSCSSPAAPDPATAGVRSATVSWIRSPSPLIGVSWRGVRRHPEGGGGEEVRLTGSGLSVTMELRGISTPSLHRCRAGEGRPSVLPPVARDLAVGALMVFSTPPPPPLVTGPQSIALQCRHCHPWAKKPQ